jgi:hypothetical protein
VRLTLMLAAFAAIVLGGSDHSGAQSASLTGPILWAPNPARSVTVSRRGHALTTLSFPAGTFLSASYDDREPNLISPGRWEFHGNFQLRATSAAEMVANGKTLAERMNGAPLVLTATDMDVTIENVNQ